MGSSLFGPLRPAQWVSLCVGVLWEAAAAVILARPPSGASPGLWRLGFALSPLLGLGVMGRAVAGSHVELTALGITRGWPRRPAVRWGEVARLALVAVRLRFPLIPGLAVGAITVHRVCPAVVTTGSETVLLVEIGYPLTDRGLRTLGRRSAALAAYARLDAPALAPLADYRAQATRAPVQRYDS